MNTTGTNKAIALDGINDYIQILHDNNLEFGTNSFTVEAYIYKEPNSPVDWRNIVTKKSTGGTVPGWVLRLNADNRAAWFLGDGNNRIDLASTQPLNAGQWYHLAGVVDRQNNQAKLYVDGVLQDTVSLANFGSVNSGVDAFLGAWSDSLNSDRWRGKIDDVRIWNTARTATQIQNNTNTQLTGNEAGLVANYTFDDGTARDLTGNHHGTAHGFVLRTPSPSLSLDGVDDYVEIGNNEAFNFGTNDDFTIETWVKADLNQLDLDNVDNDIIEKWDDNGGGYPFVIRYLRNTGQILVARWDGSTSASTRSTTAINDGNFHHIAFVKQGETLRLYIDGKLEDTQTDTTNLNTKNNSSIYVGRRGQSQPWDNYFRGEVDEFRIWNTARTQAEIQDNASNQLTGNEAGLVANYTFDDGTARDLTGNHHGTAHGFVLKQSSPVLSLDGVDDYVSISNESNFDFTDGITVESWIKIDRFTKDWEAIVTKGDSSWRLHRASNSDTVNFAIGSGQTPFFASVSGTTKVDDGSWHHVVGVYQKGTSGNNGVLSIYIDGVLEGTTNVDSDLPLPNNNYEVRIGENAQVTGRHFGGEIDDVRIWNTARTEAQIQNNINTQLTGNEAGLVANYTFDDGSATDLTGNHNGTMKGFIERTPSPALLFDGNNSIIHLGDSSNIGVGNLPISLSAWIKPKSAGTLFGTGDMGFSFEVDNQGKLIAYNPLSPSSSITSNDNIVFGEWNHVAMTFESYHQGGNNSLNIYINGEQVGSGTFYPYIGYPVPVHVGGKLVNLYSEEDYDGQLVDFFDGNIDEFSIWNRALTQSEVRNYANQQLTGTETGLTAYYSFDDGTATDLTGNHSGTKLGFPPTRTPSQGLSFDGVDDYVGVSTALNPTNQITVELWAKSNTPTWYNPTGYSGDFVSKENTFFFNPTGGTKGIQFYLNVGNSGLPITYLPDRYFDITQWHHYAASYDGNEISLYIDGEKVKSANYNPININTENSLLTIGLRPSAPNGAEDSYFQGEIDEVRIWDTARTTTEIQDNLNTKLTGNESGLFAYYTFDDGTATDLTGNNNGQIYTTPAPINPPIAHWSLGESTGTTTAQNQGSLGTAVDGTYLGDPSRTLALVSNGDNAKDFDGIDDGILIPNHPSINTGTSYSQKTIELYFRAHSVGGTQMIYEQGGTANGLNIYLDDNRLKLGAWANNTGNWLEGKIYPNEIYHVVLTFEEGTLKSFVNGSFFGISTGFNQIPAHSGQIGIAQVKGDTRLSTDTYGISTDFVGDGLNFDGVIDEVTLYDTALSLSQIEANAQTFNTLDYVAPHQPTVDVFFENKLPNTDFGKNTNVIIGDFNGDGKDDILRQDDQLGYEVFLSYGINGFSSEVISVNSATTDTKKGKVNVHVGDFNGDGKDDFIAQYIGNTFDSHLFTSNGDGTFSQTALPAWYYIRGDFVNLIVGDFNGDGKDDFIRQEKGAWDDDNSGTAHVYLSNGNGTFSGQLLTGDLYDNSGNVSVFNNYSFKGDLTNLIVGDFNGDGTDDLIRQEKGGWDDDSNGTAHILLFDGSGTFPGSNAKKLVFQIAIAIPSQSDRFNTLSHD